MAPPIFMENEFKPFGKIPRLSRECIITEKIDGTNGQIFIDVDGTFLVGSRNRWITPEADNFGFAQWAYSHKEELLKLGPGSHFGEWWGCGIQRGYGQQQKWFSLFNVSRWDGSTPENTPPGCCLVVPTLYQGPFDTGAISALALLADHGSYAAPGFAKPEGIIIYHTAARCYFKKTLLDDEKPKG